MVRQRDKRRATRPNASAAANAKTAKKNIWNAVTPNPLDLMKSMIVLSYPGVHDQHPEIADRDREIPKRHDRALHRERRLAVGKLETGGGDQHFAESEQRIRQAPAT